MMTRHKLIGAAHISISRTETGGAQIHLMGQGPDARDRITIEVDSCSLAIHGFDDVIKPTDGPDVQKGPVMT